MIVKNPYVYLVKHFRLVHLILFLLCIFVYIFNARISRFVNEFMVNYTYNKYDNPISNYINPIIIIPCILIFVVSFMLIRILKKRNKPWKLYLLPAIQYLVIFIIYILTYQYFNNYDDIVDTAVMMTLKDILSFASLLQLPSILFFLMRVAGVDLRKFRFNSDSEILQLSGDEQKEIELNVNFDKYALIRVLRRTKRNLGYVYGEHKKAFKIIIIILIIVLGYNIYRNLFVYNKAFNEKENIDINGYTININNSYYTDRDYNGDILDNKHAFIILKITMKNNTQYDRNVNLDKFHILNGNKNYVNTMMTYQSEFEDFGKTLANLKLKENDSKDFILIFKVDKNENLKKYVLYYQDFNNLGASHLRKIKIKLEDIRKIKSEITATLKEDLDIKYNFDKEETLSFDDYEFSQEIEYTSKNCSGCKIKSNKYIAKEGYKILSLDFSSFEFESPDMIDFANKYGKISYKDILKRQKQIEIENFLKQDYLGKHLYILVPDEVSTSKSVNLVFTVRNNRYIYKIVE